MLEGFFQPADQGSSLVFLHRQYIKWGFLALFRYLESLSVLTDLNHSFFFFFILRVLSTLK